MLIILLLLKMLRQILELLNLNLLIESELLSTRIFKGCTQNWSREIIVIDSVLKTIPWTYKIEELKGKKIMASFYEKKLLLLSIS